MKTIVIMLCIMLIGCTTKPDVIIMDGNTYYFSEGVENFYIVDPGTGEAVEVKG